MILLSAFVIGLWVVYPFAIRQIYPDIGERGQFGDMFGAINALFAGFAFAGIIWAIILQKNELRLQREELKLQRDDLEQTREEIKGQKEQLKAQDQTLKKQTFENSFFQLLRFHIDIVDSLEVHYSGRTYTGRDSFAAFIGKLKSVYNSKPGRDINYIWRGFSKHYQRHVDHYFRHLYNTIKFVDRHVFLQGLKEKQYYINLIRGQLSSNEVGLLFYNCLSDKGGGLKCLVERYSLLEGMDMTVLLDSEHKGKFTKVAYGYEND